MQSRVVWPSVCVSIRRSAAPNPCAAPMPCSSTASPMPLGQHVFGSVFNSVRMLCECFHHHIRPRCQLPAASCFVCTCSRDGLRAEQSSREAWSMEAQPQRPASSRLCLGDQRQQQQRSGRRDDAPLGKLHTSHYWAEFRNGRGRGRGRGRAPNALHISQGGVGERRPTSVLGLRGACTRSSPSHNSRPDWPPSLHPRARTSFQESGTPRLVGHSLTDAVRRWIAHP